MWILNAIMDPTVLVLLALLLAGYILHRVMSAREAREREARKGEIQVVTIQSGKVQAAISEMGAQLVSFKAEDGREIMWRADPAVWGKCAPILFPIVGRVKDDRYEYGGKTYSLPCHGFAAERKFTVIERGADSVWMELQDDAETREGYPFPFVLRVGFTLEDRALDVTYEVTNPGETEMLFSIGGHPGFACDLESTDLVFEGRDRIEVSRLKLPEHLLGPERTEMRLDKGRLRLETGLFDADAMILPDPPEAVEIAERGGPARLRVSFAGFPTLGIWSRKGQGAFVCIEPWYGCDDPVDASGKLAEKPGIVKLGPGEVFDCTHRIEILGA